MMKSKPSLRNLARAARNSFIFALLITLLGCSSSIESTYLKENIDKAVSDICKTEYQLDIITKLVGRTLWVYIPVEDLLVASDKPEKYTDRFAIDELKANLENSAFKIDYSIKPVPETEKYEQNTVNKKVLEKTSNVWKVIRRVLFSTKKAERDKPLFCSVITADIKNGLVIHEIVYEADLRKFYYGLISNTEFQHRSPQVIESLPGIIGDKEGKNIDYKDLTMDDFIVAQVLQRVKVKFQKPEVPAKTDIEKEIVKVAAHVFSIYNFEAYDQLDITNLLTKNRITLNKAAVSLRAIEN